MRLAASLVVAFVASAPAPAIADPIIKTSMPAIHAAFSNGKFVVRMERSLTGAVHNMAMRTMTVVARDADGKVVYESSTPVTHRMTYARVTATPALQSAATVAVSLR